MKLYSPDGRVATHPMTAPLFTPYPALAIGALIARCKKGFYCCTAMRVKWINSNKSIGISVLRRVNRWYSLGAVYNKCFSRKLVPSIF